jgi:hypothetical protein
MQFLFRVYTSAFTIRDFLDIEGSKNKNKHTLV